MKRICVYCGSSPGKNAQYGEAARILGQELSSRGLGLVYGGASVGVMGAVADSALKGGAEVIGVIPRSMATREVAHRGLDELLVVESMHERKARMEDLSDGFIALPGGWGTIEEIFEMLTWAQLGYHDKPCGLLNTASYFDQLFSFLEHGFAQGFVREQFRPMLMMEDCAALLLDRFETYQPPRVKKWISREET